jgi:hypothetical protein
MAKKENSGNDAAARYMVDVLRYAAGSLIEPLNYLRNLSVELVGWIRKTAGTINRTVRLANILRGANLAIADTYRLITQAHSRDLRDLARASIEGARSILTAASGGADIIRVSMTPARAVEISKGPLLSGATVAQTWTQQGNDLKWRFRTLAQDGIFRDQSAATLTDRILGTKESNFSDGLMPKKMREAETITQTAATAVANAVLAESYQEARDVETVTWSATLDRKVCRVCSGLHGKTWVLKAGQAVGQSVTESHGRNDKGKAVTFFLDWPGHPPIHRYCRCVLTPGLVKWSALSKESKAKLRKALGDDAADVLEAMKEKVFNGEPPDVQTFDEWLAGKTHAEVEKILGPGRARLWEKGLSVDAMLNPSTLKPLTIAEMEEKWAGERARSNRDFIGIMRAAGGRR